MKKIFLTAAGATLIFAAFSPAGACGPYFQPSYIYDKNPYRVVLNHDMAMVRLANSLSDLQKEKDIFPEGTSTEKAVIADFDSALAKYAPHLNPAERQALLAEYLQWNGNSSYDLPEAMQEFILYRRGVYEMYQNGKVVPPSWQKLLDLPPEKRHFRTVWVHYMLGNIFKQECHRHYRACRDAVRAGFADTAGLARASLANEYGWGHDRVLQIHAAFAYQRHNLSKAFIDKKDKALTWQFYAPEPAILEDELCREFFAALNNQTPEFLSGMKKYKFRNTDIMAYHAWQKGDWKAAQEYIAMMKKTSLLSVFIEFQLCRMAGKNDLALKKLKTWVQMAKHITTDDCKDLVERHDGEWIYPIEYEIYGLLGNAMVLRRDFVQAADFFYRYGQLESDFAAIAEKYMSLNELQGFVDQRIKEFNLKKDHKLDENEALFMVTHLLARRAFREKRIDIAKKYMPEIYKRFLSDYLKFIARGKDKKLSPDQRALAFYNAFKIMRLQGMTLCGTEMQPDNSRYGGQFGAGLGFMACKKCSYKPGSGIWRICEEHRSVENRDGYLGLGFYVCPKKCSYDWDTDKWTLCSEHAQEAAKGVLIGLEAWTDQTKIPDYWRFHYRYRAAKIALAAGKLARDRELKALINYSAGNMLANRSPQEANIFYKRLVIHGRGTKLAAAADEKRWFPKNTVLNNEEKELKYYHSLEEIHQLMASAFSGKNQTGQRTALDSKDAETGNK